MTIQIIPSELCDYDAADLRFTIDMSTLEGNCGRMKNEFGIKSKKTGQIAPFRYLRKFYNFAGTEDMELGGWVFEYAGSKTELWDLRVVIFND